MTTGREELLPISIFACAEAMESIERFPLNPIEMEAGTDREIEGKSAPMVVCPYNAATLIYFIRDSTPDSSLTDLYLLILKRKYKEVERRKCVFSSLYFNGLPVCANA